MSAIQIYLGTEIGQWLPAEVLKSSIRRRTKHDVQFHDVRTFHVKVRSRVNLGLNFHRFYIPEVCKFSGRAIYLDAQSICLGDIAELFEMDMQKAGALALPMEGGLARDTHVILFDCERLNHWKVDSWIQAVDRNPPLLREYVGITQSSPIAKDFGDLPSPWNVPNTFQSGTKLLNFQDPFNAPWRNPDHPEKKLFLNEMEIALQNSQITSDTLQYEIAAGHIHPDIIKI